MKYTQFFGSNVENKGINQYLADSIEHLVEMVAMDEDENPITALLVINDAGHCYIDNYIDIPTGEEGDQLFLVMEAKLASALVRFVNAHLDLINILIERVREEKPYTVKGITSGVWIDYEG